MTSPLAPPPLPDPANASLFLDFDGTLVELAATPDAVTVGAGLGALLSRLSRAMPGRVALVSGRSIEQLDGFLAAHLGAVSVAGSHGAERRTPSGGIVRPDRSDALDRAAADAEAYARAHELLFEPKTLGVTLHFRQHPERGADAIAFAERIAAEYGLGTNRGKMMVEVRLPGDKGLAMRALMEAPELRGTTPWFLGDDVTDEDGFAAAAALGGAGVLVDEVRDTRARYRLENVAAVHAWLARLADAAERSA